MLSRCRESLIFWTYYINMKLRFRRTLGTFGNFENPVTYQEKLQFRKLYGNHEFYASVADKFEVRKYVAERAGERYLIPLLGVYDRLEPGVFATLPGQFIIKANHGCKWNRIVRDKSQLDIAGTVRWFNHLMGRRFGFKLGERHYTFIRPRIMIEKLLLDARGEVPWDFCFQCYNGPGGFDFCVTLLHPNGHSAHHFDRNWNHLESVDAEDFPPPRERPGNFDELVTVARAVSVEFDFVRVDLYNVEGKIYFGELTCTPAAGLITIKDALRQKMRSEMWHLDGDNPRLYRKPRGYRGNAAATSSK